MKQFAVFLLGLALLATVSLHAARTKAPAIEADIQARVETELANISMSKIEVDVDGRDVKLSGTVVSDSHTVLAEETARDTRGVRSIESDIRIGNPENIE